MDVIATVEYGNSFTAAIQSQNIFLGSKNANEPLLLGNQTVNLLNQLIENTGLDIHAIYEYMEPNCIAIFDDIVSSIKKVC